MINRPIDITIKKSVNIGYLLDMTERKLAVDKNECYGADVQISRTMLQDLYGVIKSLAEENEFLNDKVKDQAELLNKQKKPGCFGCCRMNDDECTLCDYFGVCSVVSMNVQVNQMNKGEIMKNEQNKSNDRKRN